MVEESHRRSDSRLPAEGCTDDADVGVDDVDGDDDCVDVHFPLPAAPCPPAAAVAPTGAHQLRHSRPCLIFTSLKLCFPFFIAMAEKYLQKVAFSNPPRDGHRSVVTFISDR